MPGTNAPKGCVLFIPDHQNRNNQTQCLVENFTAAVNATAVFHPLCTHTVGRAVWCDTYVSERY